MKKKYPVLLLIKLSVICLLTGIYSTGLTANRIIKVAAIQMDAVKFDKEANFIKAEGMIREAASKGADIVCLPECALTGYPRIFPNDIKSEEEYQKELAKIRSVAEPIPGKYSRKFSELAKETGVYIITGYEELKDDKIYNTCIVIDPQGNIVGTYSKVHLQNWMVYSGINPGTEFNTFDININDTPLKIGINICYDIQVQESARINMMKGADLLFVPYCTNGFSSESGRWLFRLRAMENQFYICRVNFAHPYNNGDSMLIDPNGNVLFGGMQNEGVIIGEVDLDFLDKVRNSVKIYGPTYRKPEVYKKYFQ